MRLAIVALLLALLASGCGRSGGARTSLIVDTDLSSDDIVALMYVAQDAKVDLRAVTVSGTGLVRCPGGARIAADLLALAGRPDVPVACGGSYPLAGLRSAPDDWRDNADRLFGLTVPRAARDPRANAVTLLRETIERGSGDVSVLELAPMTNLAETLRAKPRLARTLRRVVAMGGAIDVPGNAPEQPLAETNAWLDPTAARVVLRSGASVTLVPLDATNGVPVTTFFAQALARYHYATPAATLASELIAATNMARGGSYLWDPLAAVAAVRPDLVTTVARHIDVATTGQEAGRTFVGGGGRATSVVGSVDRPRFEREVVGTLLGGAPFAIPPHRARGTLTFDSQGCAYRGATDMTAGEVVLDTVNRAATPFQYGAGRLAGTHTLDDLKQFARGISSRPEAPSWFTIDASGSVPPRSAMTWVVDLRAGTTGETVLFCATSAPPRAWIATSLPVYARR